MPFVLQIMRMVFGLCFSLSLGLASSDAHRDITQKAKTLYEHTDYQASLQVLATDPAPDATECELMGEDYFGMGNYKKAVELFEKALTFNPQSSEYELWLGRTYGRRAETGGWLMAAPNASRARQHLEKAAALDPHNSEALNDLFDYYLNAPEIMGGGLEKAEGIARRISNERPAESHWELAQIADHRKQFDEAESHLRKALELAPRQVGRVLDLARYLAKHGRLAESDALFAQANQMAPNDTRVLFARAKTYIDEHRNFDEARRLLQQYIQSSLKPDDPPKSVAEKLLRQASGG
jgi:tetratricopeptide (TPR) repeat protein